MSCKGDLLLVIILVDYGIDINADNGGGKTPLMFTAMFGYAEIVDYLFWKKRRHPVSNHAGCICPADGAVYRGNSITWLHVVSAEVGSGVVLQDGD